MNQGDRPVLRAVTLSVGIATCAVGLMFLTLPTFAQMGNEWILAALLIAGSVMTFGFAITTPRVDVRIYTILLAAASLVTGVIILVHPLDTFITLTTLLGFYFMVESGLMGGMGASLRHHRSASAILLFIAAVSFVMSALIWIRLAGASKSVIVELLGISFVARGMAYASISLMMKGQAPLPPSKMETKSSELKQDTAGSVG